MELKKLTFAGEAPGVVAVQTMRGSVTAGDSYSQWNLCDYTGDSESHVRASREDFALTLGINPDRLIMPRQTHSCKVAVVDHAFMAMTSAARAQALNGVDALVTRLDNLCIGVNTADCVPIVLADATSGIVAVAHAGWRGTVARIAQATVSAMETLGAEPREIMAAMGASICARCFEVGDEVAQEFAAAQFPMAAIMHRNALTGKAHIDLGKANLHVLLQAGLQEHNIKLPHDCSRCSRDLYFSARRLGINSGRTFTAIIKREEKKSR